MFVLIFAGHMRAPYVLNAGLRRCHLGSWDCVRLAGDVVQPHTVEEPDTTEVGCEIAADSHSERGALNSNHALGHADQFTNTLICCINYTV